MLTVKIKENSEQARAFISYLKTLDFVEVIEEEPNLEEPLGKDSDKVDFPAVEDKYQIYDLKEIAEELELGMRCAVHRTTGEILSYPGEPEMFDDPDGLWEEITDKIEMDAYNFININPMEQWQSYELMKDFAEGIKAEGLRKNLLRALENRKPFRNFSNIIEDSDLRQNWFDYKLNRYKLWVKEQIVGAQEEF